MSHGRPASSGYGSGGAIEYRPYHFETAIDGSGGYVFRKPIRNEVLKRRVVDSVKLECSNVRNQHPNVPSRNIDTSLVL